MSSNTGDANHAGTGRGGSAAHGYETRDANTGAVLGFLAVLFVVLMATLFGTWLMFRYFDSVEQAPPSSSFAGVRRVPVGPELQVNAHQDLLKTLADQQQALEQYSWEDRKAGTIRIPIEQAMDLLVKRGLPVLNSEAATGAANGKRAAEKSNGALSQGKN